MKFIISFDILEEKKIVNRMKSREWNEWTQKNKGNPRSIFIYRTLFIEVNNSIHSHIHSIFGRRSLFL